jgi:hypothetical protein
MVSKLRSGLLLLSLLWMNSAFATLITFEGRANDPTRNGEVLGTEWLSRGLLLTSPTLALNVGCGDPVPCLGADQSSVSDFNGILNGRFVVPGTLLPSSVFSLGIEFCCEDFDRPPGFDDVTITSIFDTSGGLLARIFDDDFFFTSTRAIGSFSVDFGSDAMLGIRFNSLPEPAPLGLVLMGLLGALLLPKRRRCA